MEFNHFLMISFSVTKSNIKIYYNDCMILLPTFNDFCSVYSKTRNKIYIFKWIKVNIFRMQHWRLKKSSLSKFWMLLISKFWFSEYICRSKIYVKILLIANDRYVFFFYKTEHKIQYVFLLYVCLILKNISSKWLCIKFLMRFFLFLKKIFFKNCMCKN